MNINFKDAVEHISDYFEKHLPLYTIFEVRRQSYDPDDYLYMITAQKPDGTFTIWTSWNESIQSLNHGYDLPNLKLCIKIMEEYQNTHSTYCTVNSEPLEYLRQLLIKHDDNFEDSYQQILYISGFCDGIAAQRKNNWCEMTESEIGKLYHEALKD